MSDKDSIGSFGLDAGSDAGRTTYRQNSFLNRVQAAAYRASKTSSTWVPPARDLGSKLLQALEYNPLTDKDIYGLKVSTRVLKHLNPSEVRDLVEVFKTLDIDTKNYLTATELHLAMRALNFDVSLLECEKYIIEQTFASHTKGIDINEFLEYIIDNQYASKDHYDELLHSFDLLDIDKTGQLSIDTLRKACEEAKLNLTDRELKEMIEEADQNGDLLVNKVEFIDVMLKTNLYSS